MGEAPQWLVDESGAALPEGVSVAQVLSKSEQLRPIALPNVVGAAHWNVP